ncbi:MAG: F0F1 ATP synthase subunit B [Chitinophagales bacterium]|nr:F0F1 ATP synthase subunit B [Chitinophagales bacterium]MDW8428862.1 F0F1 ATP synthase subunit B [Chitinophagales bacterium]
MQLLQPGLGLMFWTLVVFLIVLFILRRYAWRPILQALDQRQAAIDEALKAAERTRQEMANLKSEHEALLQQARQERIAILGEANRAKERIIAEAREKAAAEAARLMEEARRDIENRKMEALVDLKNQIGNMVVDVAEKVLRHQLANREEQEELIRKLTAELTRN